MKSMLESSNPLYGRIDLFMELGTMDYYDAAKFYPDFSDEDKVRLYSVFGGIPYYNRLIQPTGTVRENIYRYVFRYLSQRQLLDPEVLFDRFVAREFEEHHVPHVFEEICRQYLVCQNRIGAIEPSFDAIGRYWYNDPQAQTNGEFDVVTHDPKGYIFYEVKFRKTPVTWKMIDEKISQVIVTRLDCYAYGFFSRSGFEAEADEASTGGVDSVGDITRLIPLADLYR